MKGWKGHFTSEWKFEGLKMCNIEIVEDELSILQKRLKANNRFRLNYPKVFIFATLKHKY